MWGAKNIRNWELREPGIESYPAWLLDTGQGAYLCAFPSQ